MARCDEGYRCEVCGEDVESITDSDLYLRYVLGEVTLEWLHRLPERHIRCNPVVAQYIVDDNFPPVQVEGCFAKEGFDRDFVLAEECRITEAWRWLQKLPTSGLALVEYPLAYHRSAPNDPRSTVVGEPRSASDDPRSAVSNNEE